MKRCLLIVLGFFLSIGILSAQDVIYSGYGSLSDSSNKVVRVWQNDKLLYEIASPQADAFVKSMQAGSNGQYLGGYVVPSNGLHEARIWHDSTLLFSCGQGSEVCNLAVMGDTVYAAGYTTIDSVTTAATVWKNGSLLFLLGDSTSDTKANAITISGNDIITAGYSENSSGQKTALIWQNDSLLYSIGDSAFHAELLAIISIRLEISLILTGFATPQLGVTTICCISFLTVPLWRPPSSLNKVRFMWEVLFSEKL